MIMLALAIVMLTKPELMNKIDTAVLIFLSAVASSFIVMWLHRKILPKFGIKIGTEGGLIKNEKAKSAKK
jgi:hypothetical protein